MFTPIDLETWPRREHYAFYNAVLPVGLCVTVRVDVTAFRAMTKERGLKFYPAFIWCVSHTILSHPAFRMAVDGEGRPGCHDVLHPVYTVFHEDDRTFSDLWTEHDEDFPAFYRRFLSDVENFDRNHGIKAKPGQPAAFYCISAVPWLDFTGYSAAVAGAGKPALFPVITYGKITAENGQETLPFALNIAHAAADGWHVAAFFRDLQNLLDTVVLDAADPKEENQ